MPNKYSNWIDINYPIPQMAYLQCTDATLEMKKAFPELTRVRGQIDVMEPHGLPPTKTTHWWLVTENGEIVDPTAHQYPTRIVKYTPVDETRGGPTGKCPNCGGLCYEGDYLCSKKCEKEYLDYINERD